MARLARGQLAQAERPMSATHEAARDYARRGIPTFPCAPNGKHPITTHGVNDATTDPDQIDRWFGYERRANLAVPTGSPSRLVVLDIDMKHGVDGLATLARLEADLGALPVTLTSTTPNRGQHRWFPMPPDVAIRCDVSRIAGEDAPGLDVRGTNGYVLVPPSAINGSRYSWLNKIEPAALPARWIEALSRRAAARVTTKRWQPRRGEHGRVARWCISALQREARGLAATPPGERNVRLWRAAAALGGLVHFGAIGENDVREALTWACSRWSERDARKDADTLERGLAWGTENPLSIDFGDDSAP